jgi:hypothetical protein
MHFQIKKRQLLSEAQKRVANVIERERLAAWIGPDEPSAANGEAS